MESKKRRAGYTLNELTGREDIKVPQIEAENENEWPQSSLEEEN
jgi:hypothetical protein